MDRFVTRELRNKKEYPEGNQMIAFSATTSSTGNNITIPENNIFYDGGGQNATVTVLPMGTRQIITPQVPAYIPNVIQTQGQFLSGIDPRYLATYTNNHAAYAQPVHTFGSDYQNRSFTGADTNRTKAQIDNYNFNRSDEYNPNIINRFDVNNQNNINRAELHHNLNRAQVGDFNRARASNTNFGATNGDFNKIETVNYKFSEAESSDSFNRAQVNTWNNSGANINNPCFKGSESSNSKSYVPQAIGYAPKKQSEIDLLKLEQQKQVKTRADRLKELHVTGTRVFSGPVEKIIKWHKSLQDIGVMVLYETVGKCVNVRRGESCAKNLVVRDEDGPAIQVVYYEIDFFLPELKPPCTVRVIGRMLPGTSRFQAFHVRPATSEDVATLPRRAAVATHHVAKLCKEYGPEVLILK